MINIVNLPPTPTDFFATPTIHIQSFTFILSPEDINNEHAELQQARKEIKRSLSSPALFEYPKMTSKVHYLPDGRKTHNGKFEQSQSDVLWEQLLKRSLSKQILNKIEDMIESSMEIPLGYKTVKLLTSCEKVSPQSSLALEENTVVSNNEPNFSQTFPQKLNACKWLIRKPSRKSKHEELKPRQHKTLSL